MTGTNQRSSGAADRALAIVGMAGVLPDAPNLAAFWDNVVRGRYSISDVSADRWDPALYYDPDPAAPDKTYSKIGGWVREFEWEPMRWKLPIPPKVADAMDESQKWAVACARMALLDYGWPDRPLDRDRTAVVLGTAMGGDKHYQSALRVFFPEVARALAESPAFAGLDEATRERIARETHDRVVAKLPIITEDTMPGELANVMAGRIANLFDLHGPNFTTDAACASALAAIDAAHDGLLEHQFDVALVGGVDRNMGPSPFVKFCKIGALSSTGTRPYGDGADGFVMGEGAGFFVLKRLADAERAGDRIYAVLRGVGGSSDGRGKGITAPNPVGQRLAIERAWRDAGLSPATCGLVEGHGTSTRVGDVVEFDTLTKVFGSFDLPPRSIPLGSVKSNIGHLKGAAGAAGMLKAVMALHERKLPPSLNAERPNPNIDFARSPLYVNGALRDWAPRGDGEPRRACVSAFGFGGTNFHTVLEEHVPGLLTTRSSRGFGQVPAGAPSPGPTAEARAPLVGAVALGAPTAEALERRLAEVVDAAGRGDAPSGPPAEADLRAQERVAIAFADATDLVSKGTKALKAFGVPGAGADKLWKALRTQGVFRGRGAPSKAAFMYTGQGSQYANMLRALREREPVVRATFDEADRVMTPLLGKPLSEIVFVDPADPAALEAAEASLMRTEITQPAVLATDVALTRLLAEYGIVPDTVIGHSLGEYGALVAAGALPFDDALEAVSARGREMSHIEVDDNGIMAAVFAPLDAIEKVVASVPGNVVVANINSQKQAVIGGATEPVRQAMTILEQQGATVVQLPVSHAFHTSIVAPASQPLRAMLERLRLAPPELPLVSNVTGELYPTGPGARDGMLDLLARQVASPVQFVKGLETLYAAGVRTFVEVGPKRALQAFAADVVGERDGVVALHTNHPKMGDALSFDIALAGLWAAGLGVGEKAEPATVAQPAAAAPRRPDAPAPVAAMSSPGTSHAPAPSAPARLSNEQYGELGRLFADVLQKGSALLGGGRGGGGGGYGAGTGPAAVTGAGLGLPGRPQVFADDNVARILEGEQEIDVIPTRFRRAIVDKHITRLVKSDNGGRFETIDSAADVIKLAGRAGALDIETEFGVAGERVPALDQATKLAIAVGIEALRDAGIPLVLSYRKTSKGTYLPERWMLPDALRDETGVIFAGAFPGHDALIDELSRYFDDRNRRDRLETLRELAARAGTGDADLRAELDRRIRGLEAEVASGGYVFDRRFIFRILAMGHSQFAEHIGARGPNTHVNSACASTTQAFSLAEDWIAAGRCRRVVVVSSDDVTSDHMLEWIGAGFLATGAAATDDVVEEAALPFDRRRHGMLLGMGAAGVVVEDPACAAERGLRPICEVLSSATANSAFHGTRLDVRHIGDVMERLVAQAEARHGLDRQQMAKELLFVSHETYTPARGGSASAEVESLRKVFGDAAQHVVVANTKGLTGHAMGVGVEDVVAIKALETGVVPPVPNYKEPDPDLGPLNLSRGGAYPIRYALRLGAGFGSQISMSLLRWVPTPDGRRPAPEALGYASRIVDDTAWRSWLARVSGDSAAEVEVVQRTLRIKDRGATARAAATLPATEEQPREPYVPHTAPSPAAPSSAPGMVPAVVPSPTPASPVAPAPTASVPASRGPSAQSGSAAATAGSLEDEVRARVLSIVSEKTGYPTDMLDPDLDLEADLGIDTVKQAETFAALRAAWGIPRDDTVQLRDYPTLDHAIRFVLERAPGQGAAADSDPGGTAADGSGAVNPVPAASADPFARPTGTLDAAAAVPRRVPVPVLRPDLDLCEETGVVFGDGARVVILPDRGGVGRALGRRLEQRGVDVLQLDLDASPEAMGQAVAGWLEAGPILGVYWLPALDAEGDLTDLEAEEWREGLALRAKGLFHVARALFDTLQEPGRFLVAATRMGGRHGLGADGATNPMGGAVVGFTKALARERPDALVKAVDFPETRKTADLADALLAETLRDPGAVEVGHADEQRFGVALREVPWETGDDALRLGSDTIYLVTGAAGSITSAIVADLATHGGGGTFHLVDLAPPPDVDDPALRRFVEDRSGLKREIFERIQARGERATPVAVERRLSEIERAHAAASAIKAIEAAGGTAVYHQLDLRDGPAAAAVVDGIRDAAGRVDVLVHAGGLERSKMVASKPPEEFDLVFDVKADGWYHLLHAVGDLPLRATVCFSSIAGRFGNAGQTDYASANDLLAKTSAWLRATRPGLRAVVLDWTAWADIGMATRGSIPDAMARAGIDMLPPAAGIPFVRRELTGRGGGAEIVVAGRLGVLEEERSPTGGLDVAAVAARVQGPMLGRIEGFSSTDGLRVTTTLQPTEQPFLFDHRIDGTPVLPGVMGLEAFGEVATALFPELEVVALEDVDFLAPFKFYRDEPRALELTASFEPDADGGVVAHCRLVGRRQLANQDAPQVTEHFRARVRLGRAGASEDPPTVAPPQEDGEPAASQDDVYKVYFHGPAYRVLERAWRHGEQAVGRFARELPADHVPPEQPFRTPPRLLELCFQTAGVLEIGTKGRMGLPHHIERVSFPATMAKTSDAGQLFCVTRPKDDGQGYDADVIDDQGRVLVRMEGYDTAALPVPVDDGLRAPLQEAMK